MHHGAKVSSLLTSAWRPLEKRSPSADRAKKECFSEWWFFSFITVTRRENPWTTTTSEPGVRPSRREDFASRNHWKNSDKLDCVLWNLQVRAAFSYILNNNDSEQSLLNRTRHFLLARQTWLKMENIEICFCDLITEGLTLLSLFCSTK